MRLRRTKAGLRDLASHLRELLKGGMSQKDAAAALGVAQSHVSRLVGRFGLPGTPQPRIPVDEVRRLAGAGLTRAQIAEEIGFSYGGVADVVASAGIEVCREKRSAGRRKPIPEIEELAAQGLCIAEIAVTLQRSHGTIRSAVRRHGLVLVKGKTGPKPKLRAAA